MSMQEFLQLSVSLAQWYEENLRVVYEEVFFTSFLFILVIKLVVVVVVVILYEKVKDAYMCLLHPGRL